MFPLTPRLHTLRHLVLLGGLLLAAWPSHAARLALVIGNDSYREIFPLSNARNDARLIAATLREAGFEVERVHENLDGKSMLRAITGFKARITKHDEVVFFYAGHGVQFEQKSPLLLPVDIAQESPDQITHDGFSLSMIQDAVKEAQFSLLIIDACRDNPFPPKADGSRGLKLPPGLNLQAPPEGSVIIMSAASGQKALDYVPGGTRNNGLFTHEFVQAIKTPGQNLINFLPEVRERVQAKAKKAGITQRPAYVDESGGKFVFFPATTGTNTLTTTPPSFDLKPLEDEAWALCKNGVSTKPCISYLGDYLQGRYAKLARTRIEDLQQVNPPNTQPSHLTESHPNTTITASSTIPIQPIGRRVALLIGNQNYKNIPPLRTPINDVKLIQSSLKNRHYW